MPAYIFSIATAVPKQQYRQEDAARVMLARLGLSKPLAYKIEKIYKQTAIETRHTVLDDPFGEGNSYFFEEEKQPKMGDRNKIYKEKALSLAVETAKETLTNWQGDPQEITHVISVSCTGLFAPGLEFSLIKELGLSPRVDRLGINFMGCFGAFRGLAMAEALALENPKNRVLLVCTELCSLSFQPSHTLDALISNALFSDGASSLIVSSQGVNPSFRIVSKASFALPDSFEEMQWDASDIGFFMKLSLKVPQHLRSHVRAFVDHLLDGKVSIEECDFPLHPGGRAILEQIEEELNLTKKQTEASWQTLSEYGNMSSATFPFVLKKLLNKPQEERLPFAVGLGFGPGLAMEGILLEELL